MTNANVIEQIKAAAIQHNGLATMNAALYKFYNTELFNTVAQQVAKELPPIETVTKFKDLNHYQQICRKLRIRKDEQILQQIFRLIIQDNIGNFILELQGIKQLITHLKLKFMNKQTQQLIKTLQLKESEQQLTAISELINQIKLPQDMNEVNTNQLQSMPVDNVLNQSERISITHSQFMNYLHSYYNKSKAGTINENENDQMKQFVNWYLASLEQPQLLKQLNQMVMISLQFMKTIDLSTPICQRIDFQTLTPIGLNQLLYITSITRNTKLFTQLESKIIDYIINNQTINMETIVSYYTHLCSMYATMTTSFPDNLKEFFDSAILKHINQFNGKQLFLVFKGANQCQMMTNQLKNIIQTNVLDGKMNDYPDGLMNYFANTIKQNQRPEHVEFALKLSVTSTNFGDWCNLISQISKTEVLSEEQIERFKQNYQQHKYLKVNQYAYFVHAAIVCNVDISSILYQSINKLSEFVLVRILHLTLQSNLPQYNSINQQIIQKLQNNSQFLYKRFGQLDQGLLAYVMFTASLMENVDFFEFLLKQYKKEIESSLIVEANFEREKTFGGPLANKQSNQSQLQYYQAFLHYQNYTGTKLYLDQLEERIRHLSQTQQPVSSIREAKLQSALEAAGIQFVQDYCEILPYRIDFYMASKKIAIECNGQSHYFGGQLRRSDQLKYQILNKLGIRVVEVKHGMRQFDEIIEQIIRME